MADEEPSDLPEIEAPASADEPTPDDDNPEPEAAAAAEDPKAKREALLAGLPGVLREAFGDEPEDDEEEVVAAGLTAERLRAMDPAGRAALRAATRRLEALEAKVKAEEEARVKAAKERDAKHAQDVKALRQQEAAWRALARSEATADPGAEPDVDPFSAEGARRLAAYHAQKGLAEVFTPFRQKDAEVSRDAAWKALKETYPDLNDAKVYDEYNAFVVKMNEGIDPTKERPRVPAEIAADLFFGNRARVALEKQVADRKAREASDRAASARVLARSGSGAGGTSAVARYRQLKKTDPDAALELLERDPAVRREVLGAVGIT